MLDAIASSLNDFYKGCLLQWTNGANAGIPRTITGYVGSTKVAMFAVALPATPDSTPTFTIKAEQFATPGADGKSLISSDQLGAKGGLPILDAATGLILQGYLGGSITIGTATNLTNAPTTGDLTATMKASVLAQVAALNGDGLMSITSMCGVWYDVTDQLVYDSVQGWVDASDAVWARTKQSPTAPGYGAYAFDTPPDGAAYLRLGPANAESMDQLMYGAINAPPRVPLTDQQTADALKLAPTAGAPAAGSVYAMLTGLP